MRPVLNKAGRFALDLMASPRGPHSWAWRCPGTRTASLSQARDVDHTNGKHVAMKYVPYSQVREALLRECPVEVTFAAVAKKHGAARVTWVVMPCSTGLRFKTACMG
jgi:hypothetical protein